MVTNSLPVQQLSDNNDNKLSKLRFKVKNKQIIANLNTNSVPCEFEQLQHIIQNKVDMLVLTETKIDSSFSNLQFYTEVFFLPFRLDRNVHEGGILIYIREDIPCKVLNKHILPEEVDAVFIELNLRKQKWLLCGTYHPPRQKDEYYLYHMGKAIDAYYQIYDKFLLTGDFNAEDTEPCLLQFYFKYDTDNLMKEKTCFKSKNNHSCIDLFIINSSNNFQNTSTMTAGLSDFHKIVVTVLKTTFLKSKPRVITYRDYRSFDNDKSKTVLKNSLRVRNVPSYLRLKKFYFMFYGDMPQLNRK